MAFIGYLLKIGTYEFPLKAIEYESFFVKRNVLDLDSYRDGNGILHRNALSHNSVSVRFNTLSGLTNDFMANVMSMIKTQYTNSNEKKVLLSVYVPEIDDYITQDAYLVDPEFIIQEISDGKIFYKPITFEFVGY